MDDLIILVTVLVVLGILLVIMTVVGHFIWVAISWLLRQGFKKTPPTETASQPPANLPKCPNCSYTYLKLADFCGHCGAPRPTAIVAELLKDLAATLRQLERFRRSAVIDEATYEALKQQVESERQRLMQRQAPGATEQPRPRPGPSILGLSPAIEPLPGPRSIPQPASVVTASMTVSEDAIVIEPDPVTAHSWRQDGQSQYPPISARPRPQAPPPPPRAPRRPFSEVLAAFMEQSNIRWGEIIGGLLMIGCSTALVVSLWAQISSIPVLKFLIFTTVTAALFGVGLYTEHRWKLPMTSRGILTIATLLVPLNFLAIAAVSGSAGVLIIGSELIAPALFLCLVYFAGRVLTPKWPHLLTVAVLGSSAGQLLIRHFASPDYSPALLLALGALPIVCFVATTAWKLKIAMADDKIDETETNAIFITLGAATFAALLPFGLLLYKSGPASMSMMYLAPLVTLAGVPVLATGTLLWRRVIDKELAAARMAGTSIAIVGTMIVLAGMILSWPNPASIVPAALINFAVFTALAVLLDLPVAHVFAAACLGLAYLVLFHVFLGHVPWQNLRVASLLDVMNNVRTGQALAPLCLLMVGAFQWLDRKQRERDGQSYLIASCGIAILSLLLVGFYGFDIPSDPFRFWFFCLLYAAVGLWLAWRKQAGGFAWAGSLLLLMSMAQAMGQWLNIEFPWHSALLGHATICAIGAVMLARYKSTRAVLSRPLESAAQVTSFVVIGLLIFHAATQPTAMLARDLFWLAGVWLVLLWLNRGRALYSSFQVVLTLAVIIFIKSLLQHYEWYTYHGSLHPWSLQIQGISLLLLSLLWVGLRLLSDKPQFVDRAVSDDATTSSGGEPGTRAAGWLHDARRLLNANVSVNRVVLWSIFAAFVIFSIYGALSGVHQELSSRGSDTPVWNLGGFPHQYVYGFASWILLGLLVVAMIANLRQSRRLIYFLGALAALATVSPLAAGWWETQVATASAWRFTAAGFLLVASVPLWFRARLNETQFGFPWLGKQSRLSDNETPRDRQASAEGFRRVTSQARALLLTATLLPLLLLTIYPALRAINYWPVHGPAAGVFYLLGDRISYAIPIVIAAFVLIVYAIRERLVTYAFSAGLLFNLSVIMIYLLSVVAVNGSMNRVVSIQTIQLITITSALFAIVWLSLFERWHQGLTAATKQMAEKLFELHLAIAVVPFLLLITLVTLHLIGRPVWAATGTAAAGGLYGWLGIVLALIAVSWFGKAYRRPVRALALCASLLALGCLAAFSVVRIAPYSLAGLHALTISFCAIGWLMWLAARLPASLRSDGSLVRLLRRISEGGLSTHWVRDTVVCATVVGLIGAVLGLISAPPHSATIWSVGPLLAMSALAAALQWQTLKRGFLHAAGILFTVAVFIGWARSVAEYPGLERMLEVVIIGLCTSSIVWLWLELRARRLAAESSAFGKALSFHHLAALSSLFVIAVIALRHLTATIIDFQISKPAGLEWLSIAAVVALLVACIWDKDAKYAVASLYLLGLLIISMTLSQLHVTPPHLAWTGMMALAIYAIATAVLWHWRATLIQWSTQLRIPQRLPAETRYLEWLVIFNVVTITTVAGLAYWIDLRFAEWGLRITAAIAVAAQAFTLTLLAPTSARQSWQRSAFAVLALGAVLFGWAWLVPGSTGTWLNRAVILMVEMFAIVALFGLELDKALEREPEWAKAVRACVPYLVLSGIIALAFVLGTEVFYQLRFGAVRIAAIPIITTAITLAASTVICVLFALSPKHDPLNLTDQRRQNYVYVAELLLALLFMHIRLTMPWLFSGFFERYWPLVVVAIAYLGVTASELLRRRQLLVLAQPLERTGAFLPLLPVIGFWLTEPHVDYSVFLFIVGGVYALLSILRRSFGFGIMAALAANGGLWYLWHRTADYTFLQHPQLWLIPAACSVLIATYLNREDFSETQIVSIRYVALTTIYVSSTADIFINGVATSPWLPLILAALALCGVLCGMMFRIRAFLVMGSLFLLLAITTMIRFAHVNFGWTWLWYAAGIITGMLIITTFAVFEKKREEMLRVVEGLKEWQP